MYFYRTAHNSTNVECILRRRFTLTATAYKYRHQPIPMADRIYVFCKVLLLGDIKGNQIILFYTTWEMFIIKCGY